MPGIADLPVELFLDEIFAFLPVSAILSLGSTNRFFLSVADDEAFWHRRIQEDFNFSGSETARATGWKFLYERLSNPSLYVWGEKSQGRLGVTDFPQTGIRDGVPYPIRLEIPGVRIVSLVAGGMSFHAIDSRGDIYVWGVLDGSSMALRGDGFSEPSKKAERPMRLQLPVKFRTLSCGRLHTTALDAGSQVWTFLSWGRPFRLSSALLDKSSPETTPVQVESGWSFSSILTESGDVLVYWPFGDRVKQVVDQKTEEFDSTDNEQLRATAKARPTEAEPNVVPCYWWVLHGADPVRLPPIPSGSLPELLGTGLENDQSIKLVKIAAFDNNVLGLTNKGHVLRYGELYGEDTLQQGRWEYLPLFSDIKEISTLPAYTPDEGDNVTRVTPPEVMHITHISASFQTFFAYSTGTSSTVLMGKDIPQQGNTSTTGDPLVNRFAPMIIPGLQNQSVISVVLGDYHYGALTGTGKLFTWGAFSKGALGLGDPSVMEIGQPGSYANDNDRFVGMRFGNPPPDVDAPTEVHFNHGKRVRAKYCFAAAALGWHTGALVIDLDPDQEDDEEAEELHVPGSFPEGPERGIPLFDPSIRNRGLPLFDPSMRNRGLPFRIGYAGRGFARGGPPAGNS